VGVQDIGSPRRPVSSGLQVPGDGLLPTVGSCLGIKRPALEADHSEQSISKLNLLAPEFDI
jgi:hypothetical protein